MCHRKAIAIGIWQSGSRHLSVSAGETAAHSSSCASPFASGRGNRGTSGRIWATPQLAFQLPKCSRRRLFCGRLVVAIVGDVRDGRWRRNHGSACPHAGHPKPSPAGEISSDRGVQRADEHRPVRLRLVRLRGRFRRPSPGRRRGKSVLIEQCVEVVPGATDASPA